MEDIEINSKINYRRDRVMSGNEPHKILQMIQKQALEKEAKD